MKTPHGGGLYRRLPDAPACARCGTVDPRVAGESSGAHRICSGCVAGQFDLLALSGIAMVTAGAVTCSGLLLGSGLLVPAIGAWVIHRRSRS